MRPCGAEGCEQSILPEWDRRKRFCSYRCRLRTEKRRSREAQQARLVPDDHAQTVYAMYGKANALLYVGVSKQALTRITGSYPGRGWWREVRVIKVQHFDSRAEALAKEEELIRTGQPAHNGRQQPQGLTSQ